MLNENYIDDEKIEIGIKIAEIFNLRKCRTDKNKWQTKYGPKTDIGVFYMFENIACKIRDGQKIL